ncbi:MAG: nucleoside transporter C-terminal domain-containing protein [Longimicrobiales bacterium]|nr:nucleoside transporter C-terminal domain-containing protein [Longimicrobiales bacterium]
MTALSLLFQDPAFAATAPARVRAAVGAVMLIGVAWGLSSSRDRVSWRLVGWGLGLQLAFAFLVLQTPFGVAFFDWMNGLVRAVLGYAEQGGRFVFGNLVSDNVPVGTVDANGLFSPEAGSVARTGAFFAFRIFPNIIFVSALMTVMYHLGIMQAVVRWIAWVMQRTMRTSGAETLCAASNIFVGLMEAPLVVKPFIAKMTESELMALMTAGMATISGGVLAAYAGMLLPYQPEAAGHLIAASIMSAPAALVMAKLLVPETGTPVTADSLETTVENPDVNVIDAAARGASEGLRLALVVGAMLIAFVALIMMANGIVGWAGGLVGIDGLTIEMMLGWLLAPVAWMLGIPWVDATIVGQLIGVDFVVNEFVAFVQLEGVLAAGTELQARSLVISIYALATFANFGSVAMTIAGVGELAPERRHDLARLGVKAMFAGLLAALLTAAFAGVLV